MAGNFTSMHCLTSSALG